MKYIKLRENFDLNYWKKVYDKEYPSYDDWYYDSDYIINKDQLFPGEYLEIALNLKRGFFSEEWNYINNVKDDENLAWMNYFSYKKGNNEDSRKNLEKIYDEFIKLNPKLKRIPVNNIEDKYHVILGATSKLEYDDIYYFVTSQTGGFNKQVDELQEELSHKLCLMGYCSVMRHKLSKNNLMRLKHLIDTNIIKPRRTKSQA